ncbi:MAG: class I SAM-dependent rRNA methyltransferase [Alphaproteobacteria bacterium]|nr:class I SAM-dependent rRNA methyltransferase [Alphaproteobacteria bacterium]
MAHASLSPGDRPALRLLPGHDRRVRAGHPWVFSNELSFTPAMRAMAPGSAVRLESASGGPLGLFGFNPHSLIAARRLAEDPAAALDAGFFAARLDRALALRSRLFTAPYYRLVHAEADGLPGLIVDRFDDVLIVQQNAAIMAALEAPLLAALREHLSPRAIVLRNDAAVRSLEGLAEEVRVAEGAPGDAPILVRENGVAFPVDPLSGQKTGWFYDQRPNRDRIAALCAGARVLDAYCHTGAFGLRAAGAGAAQVLMLDRSEPALALARAAAARNGLADRVEFRRAEAFAELERMGQAGERFDVVICDPPAFVKSRRDHASGVRGYGKLARLAARLVAPGGFLFLASCSHHVAPEELAEQIARGLHQAGRAGRILGSYGAGPDHPVHPALPESAYLKAQLLALD